MKSVLSRKWGSYILIICMVFFGMCFENYETDAFSYTDSQTNVSYLDQIRSSIFLKDICTEELTGIQTIFHIIIQETRTIIKISPKYSNIFVLLLGVPPDYLIYLSKKVSAILGKNTTFSSAFIIKYIHQQDGEKDSSIYHNKCS